MNINRRDFFRSVAAIGSSMFFYDFCSPQKAIAKNLTGNPDRFGILVDMTRCFGCRRCEEACNKVNSLPEPDLYFEDKSVFEKRRRPDAQTYTVVNRYPNRERLGEPVYRKIQCMHCDEPACVASCLVGALKKTPEWAVTWNDKVCLGCRYCMNACPFYIPSFEYNNAFSPRIQKCSMCYEQRILKGQVPACATECPVEALTFGKRSDLLKIARERFRLYPDKYIDHIYGEHEAGGTSWLYIGAVPFEQVDLPVNIGNTAYPVYTQEFLSFVPLVLTVWPPLFGGFYLFSKHRQETAKAEHEKSVEEEKK